MIILLQEGILLVRNMFGNRYDDCVWLEYINYKDGCTRKRLVTWLYDEKLENESHGNWLRWTKDRNEIITTICEMYHDDWE